MIEDDAITMAELMFKMEKTCRLKEELFCSKCGLSPMELRCLRQLLDNHFTSVKELSTKMDLTPGRLTHLLNGLEKKKFITRTIDDNDRRIINVALNDEGKRFAKKTMEDYVRFHLQIVQLVDKKQLSPMLRCLQSFLDHVTYFIDNHKN